MISIFLSVFIEKKKEIILLISTSSVSGMITKSCQPRGRFRLVCWFVFVSFDQETYGVNYMQMNWLRGRLVMPVSYSWFLSLPANDLAEFQGLLFLTCKMVIIAMSSVEREMWYFGKDVALAFRRSWAE